MTPAEQEGYIEWSEWEPGDDDDDDCDGWDEDHIIGSCARCGCNLYDDECDETETYCDSCHWWIENS
jgi:hypothetical protein